MNYRQFILGLLTATFLAGSALATPTPVKEEAKPPKDPYVLMELFGAVFSEVKEEYVEETDDQKMIETAIDGMLTALDPHSGYMDESSFETWKHRQKESSAA